MLVWGPPGPHTNSLFDDEESLVLQRGAQGLRFAGPHRHCEDTPSAVGSMAQLQVPDVYCRRTKGATHPRQFPRFISKRDPHSYHRRRSSRVPS